jgi:hypothetical protein
LNLYGYVENNPPNSYDPLGLEVDPPADPSDPDYINKEVDRIGQSLKEAVESLFDIIPWGRICKVGAGIGAAAKKLGPSGKPMIHVKLHPSRKRAKDAARNEGKGCPVNHPSPKVGGPHYHATGADGNKQPGSTHHEYRK